MCYYTSLKDRVCPLEGLMGVCMSVEVRSDGRTQGNNWTMQGKLH